MSHPIELTLYTDAACPWAYSARPALRVLGWRYGEQLRWRLVMIGLTEHAGQYAERGYTPVRGAQGQIMFRRYGMPFAPAPKTRLSGTARGCRAVVATRLFAPGREWNVLDTLQLQNFTTPLLLDDDEGLRAALATIPGLDAAAIIAALDSPEVDAAYEADRSEARSAAGSPTELQGKAANSDGAVRYTAPSVVLERDGVRLEAGGFQPVEAYDVLVANLDPTLERREPPADPAPLLDYFRAGLTSQEVAALLARGNDPVDRPRAELALIELAGAGGAVRLPVGDDALWLHPDGAAELEEPLASAVAVAVAVD
ncbi:MAG TPA: DsbA family protein [Solirubrobacteraceae bacterium]|nr:DsbA family protein [Solirubrobacteraceae bacterium]